MACLSFTGNADNTNKLNDKAVKSHGIGLKCIIVIFAGFVVVVVLILLDSTDSFSCCDKYRWENRSSSTSMLMAVFPLLVFLTHNFQANISAVT